MKLRALRLHNVRRFDDRGIAIEGIRDGINVLSAANESGKSTCFDALQSLFFIQHTSESAPVLALRPYSGGHPLIEADIETSSGRYRLAKQFGGRKRATVTDLGAGRVLAQAGEAEDFIAGLVRPGTGGPAGLLWVRQGNTGLERQPPREEAGEKQSRETILSSVQGEVEALTGGRRMSEVLRACESDLAKFVTPTGRPKAGGPYAAAVTERDRLAAQLAKLEGEAAFLRQTIDRRIEARRLLDDITAPARETERREELARAEAAFAEASSGRDAASAAATEAKLLEDGRAAALSRLDAYRALLGQRDAAERRHAHALGRREELLARRAEAIGASDAAATEVAAAERDEAEARERLAKIERAWRSRADSERRVVFEKRLAEAGAARDEIERLEAEAKALAVPPADLKKLGELEATIAGLKAALSARAATLTMAYTPGGDATVSLDGDPLTDGAERVLPPVSVLAIAGVGALTLRVPALEEETSRIEAAEADRAARLAKFGLSDLAAVHARDAQARERQLALELARQRLSLIAPDGVAALRDELARLAPSEPEADLDDVPPEAAREAASRAGERAALARTAERQIRPRREKASEDLTEAETERALAASECEVVNTALGPADGRSARLRALEAELGAAAAAAEEAGLRATGLKEALAHLPRLEAALKRARSAVSASEGEAIRLRQEIAGLSGQIGARSDDAVDETLVEVRGAHEAAAAAVARVEEEIEVLKRLREVLQAARVSAREHYFEPVMRELRPLLGMVFDDAQVVFDDGTLLPRQVRRGGQEEAVDALSGGSREQLAVLTRLAFGRLLSREGHPAPVILDDALVYSDDERIERMFDALHRQADDQQIIVFSCRQRAFAKLGGNVLHMTPWRPAD